MTTKRALIARLRELADNEFAHIAVKSYLDCAYLVFGLIPENGLIYFELNLYSMTQHERRTLAGLLAAYIEEDGVWASSQKLNLSS